MPPCNVRTRFFVSFDGAVIILLAFVFILTHFCSNFAAGLDWFGDFIGWLVGTKVLDICSLAWPGLEWSCVWAWAMHAIGDLRAVSQVFSLVLDAACI